MQFVIIRNPENFHKDILSLSKPQSPLLVSTLSDTK